MPVASASPPLVPYGADQTVYVVIEESGAPGSLRREVERTDFETIIADLLAGQFSDPVRVVAFNTLEHWSEDMSVEIVSEIQARCDIESAPIPDYLKEFAERHGAAIFAGSTERDRDSCKRVRRISLQDGSSRRRNPPPS